RRKVSDEQLVLLVEVFDQTDTPNHEIRENLSKKLGMTNRDVQVWFQNRRAKVNR
ncbi:homeobox domain-containing protein, partial [Dimargaris cristalligena]